MSDIISREKEFLKLNEELDKRSSKFVAQARNLKTNRKPASSEKLNETFLKDEQTDDDKIPLVTQKPPIKPMWSNKSSTLPRQFRDVLTTRKSQKDKNILNLGKWTARSIERVEVTDKNPRNEIELSEAVEDDEQKSENGTTEKRPNDQNSTDTIVAVSQSFEVYKTDTESNTSSMKSTRSSNTYTEKIGKKNLSTEGLVKFLKSKITILQDELDISAREFTKRVKEIESNFEIQKKLETQLNQAISKNNSLTEQLEKLEGKLVGCELKLKDKETESASNNRQSELLKRELKIINQTNTNLEKRLYRANEELENQKNNLNIFQNNERELKEEARNGKELLERQIKTLKKQRSDLLQAYKKQLFLIDNLKRQNICLEQARLISFGEKEFTKVLDWNAKN